MGKEQGGGSPIDEPRLPNTPEGPDQPAKDSEEQASWQANTERFFAHAREPVSDGPGDDDPPGQIFSNALASRPWYEGLSKEVREVYEAGGGFPPDDPPMRQIIRNAMAGRFWGEGLSEVREEMERPKREREEKLLYEGELIRRFNFFVDQPIQEQEAMIQQGRRWRLGRERSGHSKESTSGFCHIPEWDLKLLEHGLFPPEGVDPWTLKVLDTYYPENDEIQNG